DAMQARQLALAIRERLVAAYPADDGYQRALATSLVTQSTAAAWERALAIRRRLAQAHPDDLSYQIDLATGLSLGTILERGSSATNAAAVAERRRNAEQLEAMVAAYPDVPEIRKSLANLYNALANVLLEHDPEGSFRYYQRSQQILARMADALSDADW